MYSLVDDNTNKQTNSALVIYVFCFQMFHDHDLCFFRVRENGKVRYCENMGVFSDSSLHAFAVPIQSYFHIRLFFNSFATLTCVNRYMYNNVKGM